VCLVDGDGDGDNDENVKSDQKATPVALTSDSTMLIILISKFQKDENRNVNHLIVMDTMEGLILGAVGPPLYGYGEISVECFPSSDLVAVTYTALEEQAGQ